MLPQDEQNQPDASANKQTNFGGRLPWVFVAAEFERQENHDGEGSENGEAGEVEFANRQWSGMHFLLRSVVGNSNDKDNDRRNGANGQVDIEA